MQESFEEQYIIEEKPQKVGLGNKIRSLLCGKYFTAVMILLVAVTSFSLGRISGLEDGKDPVRVISRDLYGGGSREQAASVGASAADDEKIGDSMPETQPDSGQVVASKNGSKYHYPWCSGAKQISENNLIVFNSIEEARAKGYTPASNCKGLK
jgi:hypothetical protein